MTAAAMVGVIGLARSGRSAAKLALATGSAVFGSDAGDSAALREAAAEIRRLGGEAETGGHTVERLAECDLIVISPGVPPDAPVLADPRLADIPWTSELEYAWRHLDRPVIAVTGTNGKSTVTAWIAHLLRESGTDAIAAGNIGTPLSDIALRDDPPAWVVVEASSYQLGRVESFRPRVGVVTNLAPDHLDRYPDVDSYYADKAHLFDNAEAGSVWILNGDDPAVLDLPGDAAGRRLLFRTAASPDRPTSPGGGPEARGGADLMGSASGESTGAWLDGDWLMLRVDGRDHVLVDAGELRLLGEHNVANALAAALAAHAATGEVDGLRAGLRSFPALPHRLEPVGEADGVLYVNDSKATNVASARVAVASMTRPTVLLLGGRHKGEDYGPLADALPGRVRAVVAFGEAADRIADALEGRVAVERATGPLRSVVERARGLAEPGDAVLLAPACASFDMFESYEARGREFVRVVRELAGAGLEPGGRAGAGVGDNPAGEAQGADHG